MTATLAEGLVEAPRLSAPAEARRRLAALLEASPAAELAPELERGRTRDVLLGLADHSPYLWALVREDPDRLVRLLRRPPGESLDALVQALASRRDEHEADLMPALRRAKREAALLIALADIGGVWDVVAATEALTRFADAAVRAALAFLLAQARARRTSWRSTLTRLMSRTAPASSFWRSASMARGNSTIRATSISSSFSTPRRRRFRREPSRGRCSCA